MLTPNDIHYLVGLLTVVSTPSDVDIEIGEYVYDEASESKRDVDITIKCKRQSGEISVFTGLEVKKHSRPLDATHVEQLSMKLSDMPSITNKGIVSGSGYTKPAKNKAKKHGVDLYHLCPWKNVMDSFDHVKLMQKLPVIEQHPEWLQSPHIHINLNRHIEKENLPNNLDELRICDDKGKPLPSYPNFKSLKEIIVKIALNRLKEMKKGQIKINQTESFDFTFNINEEIYADLKGNLMPINHVRVRGNLVWRQKEHETELMMLIKDGETKPHVACAVCEISNGNLIGITFSQFDRTIRFINIPISERNKKKLNNIRLK